MQQTVPTTFDFYGDIVSKLTKAEIVLDLNCGSYPHDFLVGQVHICCENRSSHLSMLHAAIVLRPGNYKIMACDPLVALKTMRDSSVDIVMLSLTETPTVTHELLAECERVAKHQIVCHCASKGDDETCDDTSLQAMRGSFDESWNMYLVTTDSTNAQSTPDSAVGLWAIKSKPRSQTMRLPLKIAVVSMVFPPLDSGQATVLERLLKTTDPDDYCLISSHDCADRTFPRTLLSDPKYVSSLDGHFYYLGNDKKWTQRLHRFPRRFRALVGLGLELSHRAKRITRIARQERCEAIVGCSGDLIDLPAAYWASKRSKVPFVAYFFDHYRYQSVVPIQRRLAHFFERRIVRNAAQVIVPNEYLRDQLANDYGITPIIVRNPVDRLDDERPAEMELAGTTEEKVILYTGQVYEAQYDAIERLVVAINLLGRDDVRLHIYTAQPRDRLEMHGIRGPVVFHDFQPPSRIREIQRQAHVLFLPLAFESPYHQIILSSAPTKLGEYLLSGVPVLAHVPPASFISWYLNYHQCGVVVDDTDPQVLAQALVRLLIDSALRARVTQNAQQHGEDEFSPQVARMAFINALQKVNSN